MENLAFRPCLATAPSVVLIEAQMDPITAGDDVDAFLYGSGSVSGGGIEPGLYHGGGAGGSGIEPDLYGGTKMGGSTGDE